MTSYGKELHTDELNYDRLSLNLSSSTSVLPAQTPTIDLDAGKSKSHLVALNGTGATATSQSVTFTTKNALLLPFYTTYLRSASVTNADTIDLRQASSGGVNSWIFTRTATAGNLADNKSLIVEFKQFNL